MKKIYNQPTTVVVNVKCVSMMALSKFDTAASTSAENGFMESHEDNSWDIWGTGDYED